MLLLLGVVICAVSGYGIYECLDDMIVSEMLKDKVILKKITKAESRIKEKELKGKLYYYYNKNTSELWAEYSEEIPKEKQDKNIINIKPEFYKMDGESITKNQLTEIYNAIIQKYKTKGAKEHKLCEMDFMEMLQEKITLSC